VKLKKAQTTTISLGLRLNPKTEEASNSQKPKPPKGHSRRNLTIRNQNLQIIFAQDQRKTTSKAKYEASCSAQNAVQLMFSGPSVFPTLVRLGLQKLLISRSLHRDSKLAEKLRRICQEVCKTIRPVRFQASFLIGFPILVVLFYRGMSAFQICFSSTHSMH
jgi:hypothetical protein